MIQLIAKIQGKNFDLALIDPNLQNQHPIQDIANESQFLKKKIILSTDLTNAVVLRLTPCRGGSTNQVQLHLKAALSEFTARTPVGYTDLAKSRLHVISC